ncbi:MAG: hypothetical protein H6626_03435 [Pseudobdellovibrionaceae bacterium]|nr:hypothetical protein [Bdellovibrionales bacterium]USN48154.1 MAG: hypothetical protein H6626_03435 [Pseudobdellovibrionaceae bacterium]
MSDHNLIHDLYEALTGIISETNGITIDDTLEALYNSRYLKGKTHLLASVKEFQGLLGRFQTNQCEIDDLLNHPLAAALFKFLWAFPLKYREEHIHLTGSLTADFVHPRLMQLLDGPHKNIYEEKIREIYGSDATPISTVQDVNRLIRLKETEQFSRYLERLTLPKYLLTSREAHEEAAYHMAEELYNKYNVGYIRLKFTLSRSTSDAKETIPGSENVSPEDVVMGLYSGFKSFKRQHPDFEFILSPSFRKEPSFYDHNHFKTKKEHFEFQVDCILKMLQDHPELTDHLREVDTVGSENHLYRKEHFLEMHRGLRKLQAMGFQIRSHHGETWDTLKRGIQSVDNAMNIWRIDALEHGVSLGINPNFYFHTIFQRVMEKNEKGQSLTPHTQEYSEVMGLYWDRNDLVRDKLINGKPLNEDEIITFIKSKYHTAQEVEQYQHDILNRVIDKNVSLITLPSSNKKLTGQFEDYKDHPFSWWEKKGIKLGVGTDNYITLNTNYIRELLILLFTDPHGLKILKLLIVATGEKRRPFISQLLWQMRKNLKKR